MISSQHKSQSNRYHLGLRVLWIVFSFFILYGSLIPFSPCMSRESILSNIPNIAWIPLVDPDGTRASIPDLVQNILFFLPFGFFGFLSMARKSTFDIAIVTFLGFLLSLCVEILQLFTVDRTSSVTDLMANTGGSLLGAVSATFFLQGYLKFIHWPYVQPFRKDKYFYLVLISLAIVAAGALQPFDFTLDVGSVGSKIKSLLSDPLNFDPLLRDEAVVFFRFFLFAFVWALWFRERNLRFFAIKGIAMSCIIGGILEGCQMAIESRMPNAQDGVVVFLGSLSGGIFTRVFSTEVSPTRWTLPVILTTWVTAGVQCFSPFRIAKVSRDFNWFPFLSYYERTTFTALSIFMESMLVYFPMGFLLQYIYRQKRYSLVFIAMVSAVIAFSLEIPQGWIIGRYPDITDVLGAIAGVIIGSWICSRWLSDSFHKYGNP